MAKEEEKKEDKPAAADAEPKKRYRKRKDMPSVAYMLKHGNPETAHLPKTKMEIYGYPVILALIFAISLLIFHHAPHEKSTHKGFRLPQRGRPPQGYEPVKQPVNVEPKKESEL